MTQSIVVQVGQCGNQLGYRFWDLALREHRQANFIVDDAVNSFFHTVDSKNVKKYGSSSCNIKARAVLIDMEEGVISELMKGPLKNIFDTTQLVTDVSGSGNNWAVGNKVYGAQYRERITNMLRHEAELCDSLQCFFLLHSMGGGTGSGLGTAVLEILYDEFPEIHRFVTAVYPSAYDDVVTSPYNTVLANSILTEYADCVIPIENKALVDLCNHIERSITCNKSPANVKPESLVTSSEGGISKPKQKKPFDHMNNIIANLLLNLTSSSRFPGSLNVDLNEIVMNMMPYPRLHFLVSSITPLFSLQNSGACYQRLDQLFTEAFSSHHHLFKGETKRGIFLACALLVRGQANISDIQRNIDRIRGGLRFAPWNEDGWKTGLCAVPPVGHPYSVVMLANNTCIWRPFTLIKNHFIKMYKKKAHLHHFLQVNGMEKDIFDTSLLSLDMLIEEYKELETVKYHTIEKPRMQILV